MGSNRCATFVCTHFSWRVRGRLFVWVWPLGEGQGKECRTGVGLGGGVQVASYFPRVISRMDSRSRVHGLELAIERLLGSREGGRGLLKESGDA